MPEQHITSQEYRDAAPLVTDAEGWLDYLCRGEWSHFIAVMAIAVLTMGIGVWGALDAAESDVYRRHAEIRAFASLHAGWER